jgi:hypothetical protein
MKRILSFLVVALLMINATNAQFGRLMDKVTSGTSTSGFDVSKLTGSVMGKLMPALSLTNDQKPKVTDAISSFLGEKAKILPLLNTDKAAYTNKFSILFGGLKTKLGGILLKDQMNKFLGLKPATNNPANTLSQLFF